MLRYKIECVHCGMLLSNGNHNTEHILDKSLGGDNTAQNKMLMCNACNSWRNELKTDWVGNNPTDKDWTRIERYVLWNFITVDYGHRAGRHIPDVHQRFLTLRHPSGKDFEFPGKRWFARSSDAAPKDTTSLNDLEPAIPRIVSERRLIRPTRGFWAKAKRWLAGSDQDHRRTINEFNQDLSVSNTIGKETNENMKPALAESSGKEIGQPIEQSARAEVMRSCVGPHLPEVGKEKLLAVISNEVKEKDKESRAIKAIGSQAGFPPSWTATRILEATFGPSIMIHHSAGATTLTTKHTSVDTMLLLLSLIPEDESIKQAELGNLVKQHDPLNRSLREFATLENYPKSKPIHEFISHLLGHAATSSSEGTVYRWKRAKRSFSVEQISNQPPSISTPVHNEHGHLPITNFSSSAKGLRLPKSPQVLANVLHAYNNSDLTSMGVFDTIDMLHENFPALPKFKLNSIVFLIKAKFSPNEPLEPGQLRPIQPSEFSLLVHAKIETKDDISTEDLPKIGEYLEEFVAEFERIKSEEE